MVEKLRVIDEVRASREEGLHHHGCFKTHELGVLLHVFHLQRVSEHSLIIAVTSRRTYSFLQKLPFMNLK